MTPSLRRSFLPILLGGWLLIVALQGGAYGPVARGQAFFAMWWILGLGFALGLLPRTRPSRSAWVAVAALLGLGLWTALGATWSGSVGRALHEASRTLGYAGTLLLVAAAFGIGRRRAAGAVTAAAVAVCCAALADRLWPGLVHSELTQGGYTGRRLGYPLNYWNSVGVWAAMTVALGLAWSAHARTWWSRALALGGVCVAVPVAYLTYSRTAAACVVLAAVAVVALSRHRWLAVTNAVVAGAGGAAVILAIRGQPEIAQGTGGAGAGTVLTVLVAAIGLCAVTLYIAWSGRLHERRVSPRRARRGLLAALAVVVLTAAVVGPAVAERELDSFQQPESTTLQIDPAQRLTTLSSERRVLWDAALDAFAARPLRGAGAGTFEFIWDRDPRWTHHVVDAHSLYLEMAAELGLPGLLLILVAVGACLSAALAAPFRRADPASAGAAAGCGAALLVFCVSAGVDWMWESTAVTTAALACAGIAVAGARPVARRRVLPRVAGTVAAVVVLAFQGLELLAAAEIGASREAVRAGQADAAVRHASAAVDAEPWDADALLQRALVLEHSGFLDAAAADGRRAAGKEPANPDMWLVLARVDAERGAGARAIADAERARVLNPANPLFRGATRP
jgi:O-Antigen ligase